MPSTENEVMNGIAPASEICAARVLLDALRQRRNDDRARVVRGAEVERQPADVLAGDGAVDRGALPFDHGTDRGDLDLLGRAGDLQLRVGADDLAREQLDVAGGVGEALQPDDHDVAACVDVGQVEVTRASGHGGPLRAGGRVGERDGGAWGAAPD